VSGLGFLSVHTAVAERDFAPEPTSPLKRALSNAGGWIEDLSLSVGKIEVRGDLDAVDVDGELVRVTPERGLVLCPASAVGSVLEQAGRNALAIDLTAALAGVAVERPDAATLLRRVTDLDLDALPAAGALAHVHAYVIRDGDERFRLFVPQEYGHYVAEVLLDAAAGLERA